MSEIYSISAQVAEPNTPFSDTQQYVMHVVSYTQDRQRKSVNVMATDPMDAIDRVLNSLGGNDTDE